MMRPRIPLFAVLVTSLLPLASCAPPPPPPGVGCSINSPSFGRFVLSGLIRPSDDYVVPSPADNSTIYLNVCRTVLKETWGVEDSGKVGVYRQKDGEKGQSLGRWNDTLAVVDGQVTMTMGEGSTCPGTTRPMSSLIAFECAHDVFGTGHPRLAGTSPSGCTSFFVWRTPHACPTSYRRGFWHSLWTVFLGAVAVLVLYLGLATAYNRFVKGKRGTDQMPSMRPDGELVQRVQEVGTVIIIWGMDRVSDLGKVLCGKGREGGTAGWTPASGRAWWEQNPGYHRQHSHPRTSSSVSPSRRAPPQASNGGAFTLGDDDDQREEARAGRVARFDEAPVPPPKVVVSSPTPSPARPNQEGPRKVDSLVDT